MPIRTNHKITDVIGISNIGVDLANVRRVLYRETLRGQEQEK